ncbi:MAG: LysR family transcriptional regulator ArgP [Desulfuromonadales bacterium]|nr:LysR family transcriptional regulator ArgP [Desulfuromonadales bacterium]
MIEFKNLQALATVIEAGGFERAARTLFVTQSAVSMRIRQLEDQVGQVLIERTTPPKPTKAGLKLIKHYKQVKCLEDEVLADLMPGEGNDRTVLSVGVNADSLSTWLLDAVVGFAEERGVLFRFFADDQEQTQNLLKEGRVVGSISASDKPVQGCSCLPLGAMEYRFAASPAFFAQWFVSGFSPESAYEAPVVIFNEKDELHCKLFVEIFGGPLPESFKVHFIPSSEKIIQAIVDGLGYGAVPAIQSNRAFARGDLVDLCPGVSLAVNLYWHCWNINSALLRDFTKTILEGAKKLLN